MSIVGIILILVGIVVPVLLFTGNAPTALASLEWPMWVWLILVVAGAAMVFLNRRPGD